MATRILGKVFKGAEGRFLRRWPGLAVILALVCMPAMAGSPQQAVEADDLGQWFALGRLDGNVRLFYYNNRNAYFLAGSDRKTTAIGGRLAFTTAGLNGFSMRLGVLGQQNLFRGKRGQDRDLGENLRALGEAWLQWSGHDLTVRAGNQTLQEVPFAGTWDFVVVPQVYQGVKLRYAGDAVQLTGVRVLRYKSRIDNGYFKHTNYNPPFLPFPPNAGQHETDGFWAVGARSSRPWGNWKLSGKAWFVQVMDYAHMAYLEGRMEAASGSVRPFLAVQWIRQTDSGAAIMGPVDNHTCGLQLGIRHGSLTVSANFNLVPHRPGSYLNGALLTPYATHESSGPLFAQPLLTSTQDLGSGRAWSLDAGFAPSGDTFVGVRYSRMDLVPVAGQPSIGQNGYMVFGIYHFDGSLKGLSLRNFFAYQTQAVHDDHYWENRLSLVYDF